MTYPPRPRFFCCRYQSAMFASGIGARLGSTAVALLACVLSAEDDNYYRQPPAWTDDDLAALVGLSVRSLNRYRSELVSAGLLHYEAGARGRPSIYWATGPANGYPAPVADHDHDSAPAVESVTEIILGQFDRESPSTAPAFQVSTEIVGQIGVESVIVQMTPEPILGQIDRESGYILGQIDRESGFLHIRESLLNTPQEDAARPAAGPPVSSPTCQALVPFAPEAPNRDSGGGAADPEGPPASGCGPRPNRRRTRRIRPDVRNAPPTHRRGPQGAGRPGGEGGLVDPRRHGRPAGRPRGT
jgi:hypothetical protein